MVECGVFMESARMAFVNLCNAYFIVVIGI